MTIIFKQSKSVWENKFLANHWKFKKKYFNTMFLKYELGEN